MADVSQLSEVRGEDRCTPCTALERLVCRIGKRAVVIALANYVTEREQFRDGVLWVSVSGVAAISQLHNKVADAAKRDVSVSQSAFDELSVGAARIAS